MASGKGCFVRILKVLCILLIVLIVLLISLFLLATGAPVSYPAPKFDGRDTGVVANIITRLARSLVDKEGRVVDIAVLRLTQNEVQTLLNAAIAKSDNLKHETLPYSALWDEGNLHVHCSMPLFSGRAANLAFEFSPIVEKGELTLVPGGGSMGQIPMPGGALDYAAKRLAQMAMQNDSARTTLSAFTRIEPGDDGTLLLMFDPRDVNTVVRILRSAGSPPEEDRGADKADDDMDADDDPGTAAEDAPAAEDDRNEETDKSEE